MSLNWFLLYSFTSNVVYLWHFGADLDPRIRTGYLWVSDLQIRIRLRIWLLSSVVTLRMKENFFSGFFLAYTQAHWFHSLIYCFKDKFGVKILFCKHYFSPLNTFMRKGKDPDPDPDPDLYLWLTDPVPDPGGKKNIRILTRIPTLLTSKKMAGADGISFL